MAFKQSPGRLSFSKTGHGLPSALKQIAGDQEIDIYSTNKSDRKNKEMIKNRGPQKETAQPYEYSYSKKKAFGKNFEEIRDIKTNEVVARSEEGRKAAPNINQHPGVNSFRVLVDNYQKLKDKNSTVSDEGKRGQLKNKNLLNERNAEFGELRKNFLADSISTMNSRNTDVRRINFRKGYTGQETLTQADKKNLADFAEYGKEVKPKSKSPMKQKVSKKTAYDIKEASNQKLKPGARKHYAENAQAAMKNKKSPAKMKKC